MTSSVSLTTYPNAFCPPPTHRPLSPTRSFHPVALKEGECEELTNKERARAKIQVNECWDAAKKDGTFGRGYERSQKQFS